MDSADQQSYLPISNLQYCQNCWNDLCPSSCWHTLRITTCCQIVSRHTELITRLKPPSFLSDILLMLDSGDIAVLALLDLSAVFDNVDHATLLQRLQISYGLGGCVIAWFASCLNNRTQYVRLHATRSSELAVLYRVPQGSVLGPILFLLYPSNLLQLVRRHQLHPHAYADDTQIYGSCRPSEADAL